VVERTVLPTGLLTWTIVGLRAAASREIHVPLGLGRSGDRLDVSWRFWPGRSAAGVALHVPGPFGVFSLELSSERQPFDTEGVADADRLFARGRLTDWLTGAMRAEARAGLARWHNAGSFATIGGAVRVERGRVRAGGEADAWLGPGAFATSLLYGGWRSSTLRHGFVFDLSGAVETVAPRTPLDMWAAGDTGHVRGTLLRAHPVLDDGRLRVDRLGRHIVQSTAEAQHWWRIRAGIPLGAAFFLDVARVAGRSAMAVDPRPRTDVDAGAGFRLALPGRGGLFRADFAHGLRDGRNAVSVAWSPECR
jgi:hypothetical protein